ncbi:MAG: hypothetical protein V3U78_07285 [Thiotrichaceae bacterium]
MFNINYFLTLSATTLVLALTPLQVSSATDYGYNSNYGHHGYGKHRRHHNYNRHHRPNYNSYGRYYYPSTTYSYSSGSNTKPSSYSDGKNCRSTYKYQYDKHGNKTRINGTLCYDSYGKAYIVPGSRYVADM